MRLPIVTMLTSETKTTNIRYQTVTMRAGISMSHSCQRIRPLILLLIGLLGLAGSAGAQTYTLSPSPFLLALDNSGKIINNGCIWTYAAGTTTAAATYSDNAGTPNTNPIRSDPAGRFTAFLLQGNSYKFVYESVCVPPAHGTTLRTADNIGAVPPGNVNLDVTGTAGQALSANDVVCLSDGSRGNTAGLWYQADADFQDVSVNCASIGVAPTAISNGATGTIRISGRVTALSGLTPGAAYYASATAGQLTATQPLLGRFVGEADTTTSLILTPNPRKTLIQPQSLQNCGRLTATTGVPVTTADVSAATSIFFTPYQCNRIALYDGTSEWNLRTFSEITISAVGCTASKPYDVFMFDSAGTVTSEILVWTNATTRATALVLQNGVWVKTGATSRRYVGSFYCNASGGQTDSTFAKQYIWNMDNRVLRAMRRIDTTASWTYVGATLRQANASAANQLEVMVGLSEDGISVLVNVSASSNAAGDYPVATIGLDSTNTRATGVVQWAPRVVTTNNELNPGSSLTTYPGVGYHTLTWLESMSANTMTVNSGSSAAQSGMSGMWRD